MTSRTFIGRDRYPRCLTVKLRGRPGTPDQAPRAHNFLRARGSDTQAVHGPLQRLLGLAGLHRKLKAISVGVENNALIITITGAARPVFDHKAGFTQYGC